MRYRVLLALALGATLFAGCYDSTQSQPRTNNTLHAKPTEYDENSSNGSTNTSHIEGGKLPHGANPKTGKP